jgi:transcription-repair coupling factor (superfamily II helicase)
VDEEQRFGVTHKERIKALRSQVDVLTLSATPIPRTLQMAVSGLRDLSLITTPPVDRRAVRTFVTAYDDQVLREAVGRELSRGGQDFYVSNRIEGIYERAERLHRLVPSARIAVAHGQMAGKGTSAAKEGGETVLEKTMLDFVEGRFDILCATAIIESGLDIPRANTIIIDRADLFGLSQLYQGTRVLLFDCSTAEQDDRRCASANRGARTPHRTWKWIQNRKPRSRIARRR